MSDIRIKCKRCGKETAVSEFADVASLTCNCGEKLTVPEPTGPKTRIPTALRFKETSSPQPEPPPVIKQPEPEISKRKVRLEIGRWRIPVYALNWILFIVLASVLAWLRYGNVFTEQGLEECKLCGMIGLLLIYVIIIVEALREEIFEGLLCVFVPGYPIYYVFVKSDTFYLRAILAAFCVAFGFDTYHVVHHYVKIAIDAGTAWIRRGA